MRNVDMPMCEALGAATRLIFTRLGWGDAQAEELAAVLPLCGRVRELDLASALTSRVASLKALRERLKQDYGVAVWLLLTRCCGVLELVAEDLRKPNTSRPRPGALAARCVSLRFQANELQRLQVRLRPTQTAACCSRDIV